MSKKQNVPNLSKSPIGIIPYNLSNVGKAPNKKFPNKETGPEQPNKKLPTPETPSYKIKVIECSLVKKPPKAISNPPWIP